MDGQNRNNIRLGLTVDIVLKEDQPTGKLTRGVVAQILTSKRVHPRGIKVRLTSGEVGRVQNIVTVASAKLPTSPFPLRLRRGGGGEVGNVRIGERHFGRKDEAPTTFRSQKKFPCPCCGFLTLETKPPGSYEICPVCYWEDDPLQYREQDNAQGSNRVSLNQARNNFHVFGACEEKYKAAVRKPTAEETP